MKIVAVTAMAAFAVLCMPAARAHASTFPFSLSECTGGGLSDYDDNQTTSSACSAGSASSSVVSMPSPELDAYSGASGPTGAFAESSFDYLVTIVGPDGSVPVIVNGNFTTETSGPFISFGPTDNQTATASAGLRLADLATLHAVLMQTVCSSNIVGECNGFPPSVSGNLSTSISANTSYFLEYSVNTLASYADTAHAFIDPIIFIDPSFGDAGQYTLEISPGVGNVAPPKSAAAVPEPVSWAMMIAGIGVIGTAMRRRPQVHVNLHRAVSTCDNVHQLM